MSYEYIIPKEARFYCKSKKCNSNKILSDYPFRKVLGPSNIHVPYDPDIGNPIHEILYLKCAKCGREFKCKDYKGPYHSNDSTIGLGWPPGWNT